MDKSFLLINRKKYSGKGRPKKLDYYTEQKSGKIFAQIIGKPIDPKIPVPQLFN